MSAQIGWIDFSNAHRQAELIEAWKTENLASDEIDSLRKQLMINLSPFKR